MCKKEAQVERQSSSERGREREREKKGSKEAESDKKRQRGEEWEEGQQLLVIFSQKFAPLFLWLQVPTVGSKLGGVCTTRTASVACAFCWVSHSLA